MKIETMSFSFMDTFLKCPLQHKFKYLEKRPPKKMDESNMHFGNLVHKCLENLRRDPRAEAIDEAVKKSIVDPELDFDILPSWVDETKSLLVNWLGNRDFTGDVFQTEWHFDKYIPYQDFRVNGYIDLIEMMPDGTMRITDYKTGYTVYDMDDLNNSLQLMTYALVVFDEWHPKKMEIIYDMIRFNRVLTRVHPNDLKNVITRILNIKKLIDTTEPHPKLSYNCAYCAFSYCCDAFQKLDDISKINLIVDDTTIENQVRELYRLNGVYKAVETRKNDLRYRVEEHMNRMNKQSIHVGDVRAYMKFQSKMRYDPGTIVSVVPMEDLGDVIKIDDKRMDEYMRSGALDDQEKKIILDNSQNVQMRGYLSVEAV